LGIQDLWIYHEKKQHQNSLAIYVWVNMGILYAIYGWSSICWMWSLEIGDLWGPVLGFGPVAQIQNTWFIQLKRGPQ
jgi:hypothetical protein